MFWFLFTHQILSVFLHNMRKRPIQLQKMQRINKCSFCSFLSHFRGFENNLAAYDWKHFGNRVLRVCKADFGFERGMTSLILLIFLFGIKNFLVFNYWTEAGNTANWRFLLRLCSNLFWHFTAHWHLTIGLLLNLVSENYRKENRINEKCLTRERTKLNFIQNFMLGNES